MSFRKSNNITRINRPYNNIYCCTDDLSYLIPIFSGFMISLLLAAPAPRVRRARNLIGTLVRNGLRFFLLLFQYFFIQKLGFIFNNLSGNVFQTSGVIALITLLYKKFREFPYTPVCRYTFHALAVLLHLTFKAPPTGANQLINLKNSFFSFTTEACYGLDPSIINSKSLEVFKSKLLAFIRPVQRSIYNVFNRQGLKF